MDRSRSNPSSRGVPSNGSGAPKQTHTASSFISMQSLQVGHGSALFYAQSSSEKRSFYSVPKFGLNGFWPITCCRPPPSCSKGVGRTPPACQECPQMLDTLRNVESYSAFGSGVSLLRVFPVFISRESTQNPFWVILRRNGFFLALRHQSPWPCHYYGGKGCPHTHPGGVKTEAGNVNGFAPPATFRFVTDGG